MSSEAKTYIKVTSEDGLKVLFEYKNHADYDQFIRRLVWGHNKKFEHSSYKNNSKSDKSHLIAYENIKEIEDIKGSKGIPIPSLESLKNTATIMNGVDSTIIPSGFIETIDYCIDNKQKLVVKQ